MANLVLIIGPQAVGKMTVGQELEKLTGLKLFHNHMTIELVEPFFMYRTETGRALVELFRRKIFEAVAESDLKGIIFTLVVDFNDPRDWDYVEGVSEIFESHGGHVYVVELEADLDERIWRNRHQHRLNHKPSKRDVARSEQELVSSAERCRLNSEPGELSGSNYLRINNTKLDPEDTALKIKKVFGL